MNINWRLILFSSLVLCGCHEKRWLPQNMQENMRYIRAELIAKGILLYQNEHSGDFPTNLVQLVPSYIGTNVHVAEFHLTESRSNLPKNAIIAAENRAKFDRQILIKADGKVYFLDSGN